MQTRAFSRGLFALTRVEETHELDVVRLGEHVNWRSFRQTVTCPLEPLRIARPRRGIAAHIRKPRRLGCCNIGNYALGKARARRIDYKRVELAEHFEFTRRVSADNLDVYAVFIGIVA